MADFFAELKRRHIWRIAGGYAVVAWLLLQLFNNLTPVLKMPDWTGTMLLAMLIAGFPAALIFGWTVDMKASAAADGAALKLGVKLPFAPPKPDDHRSAPARD